MTTTADIRVLPETLADTAARLRQALPTTTLERSIPVTTSSRPVVILSGSRTPIGRFEGPLVRHPRTPSSAAWPFRAAVERAGIARPRGRGPDGPGAHRWRRPRRRRGRRPLNAGLPATTVSATTINKVCGSGMKAVMLAAPAHQEP